MDYLEDEVDDMEMMDNGDTTSMEMFWGQTDNLIHIIHIYLPLFSLLTGTKLTSKNKVYEYTGEEDEKEGLECTIVLKGVRSYYIYQCMYNV